MSYTCLIKVTKDSKINYKRILGSTNSVRYKRSQISIKEKAEDLEIKISAKDAGALRATINSVLRDLHVIEQLS